MENGPKEALEDARIQSYFSLANNNRDNITWRNNPQYLLTVKKAEKVSIMITQPERRSRTKDQYPHIGFYVVKTEGNYL